MKAIRFWFDKKTRLFSRKTKHGEKRRKSRVNCENSSEVEMGVISRGKSHKDHNSEWNNVARKERWVLLEKRRVSTSHKKSFWLVFRVFFSLERWRLFTCAALPYASKLEMIDWNAYVNYITWKRFEFCAPTVARRIYNEQTGKANTACISKEVRWSGENSVRGKVPMYRFDHHDESSTEIERDFSLPNTPLTNLAS